MIVSKEVNSDLYEKVKADRETWTVSNQSKQGGYHLAGPNDIGRLLRVKPYPGNSRAC